MLRPSGAAAYEDIDRAAVIIHWRPHGNDVLRDVKRLAEAAVDRTAGRVELRFLRPGGAGPLKEIHLILCASTNDDGIAVHTNRFAISVGIEYATARQLLLLGPAGRAAHEHIGRFRIAVGACAHNHGVTVDIH